MRSQYAVSNYLEKEDPTPLSYGSIPKAGSKAAEAQIAGKRKRNEDGGNQKQSKASKIASDILSGASTRSILEMDPGYYLQHKRKIEEFYSLVSVYRTKSSKKEWVPINYTGTDYSTKEIVEWLNSNIKCTRSFRQKQLYVSGPKQCYKSTLVLLLQKFLMIYDIPKGEDFYDLYEDGLYDLAIMDEFKAHKTLQWLNEWLQGGTMNIRQKGKQYVKTNNLPVLILSNYTLQECYSKKDSYALEPTESRLTQIHLSGPLDIKGLAEAMGLADCDVMNSLILHPSTTITTVPDAPTTSLPPSTTGATTVSGRLPIITIPTATSVSSNLDKQLARRRRKNREFCARCGEEQENCRCKDPID